MFRVHAICSILILLYHLDCWSQQPAPVENIRISKLNVGSDQNEYAPVFQNGKLIFTSDNRDQFGVYFSSADSLSQLSGIYLANYLNDTTFSQPELIDNRLSRRNNSGPAWINSEENRLYFSSNESTTFLLFTSKRKGKLKIYLSEQGKGKWSKREKLAFCNNDFNYTHPYLNSTEDTLYFASDLPGGFGGFDLYYTVKGENGWSEPINM